MRTNETAPDAPRQPAVLATRRFAWSAIPVSRVGLGLSRIGSINSPISTSEAIRLIETAFDLGVNFFDTADVYGQGDSERLLGSALRARRAQIVICTKAGYLVATKARLASYAKPLLAPILRFARRSPRAAGAAHGLTLPTTMAQDFSPEHIRSSLDASLRRLRTDYVDLYMLHSPPVGGLDLDRITATLQAAKQAGKIRAIGVSCRSLEDLSAWSNWKGADAIQVGLGGDLIAAQRPLNAAINTGVSTIARQVLSSDSNRNKEALAEALRSALRMVDIVLFGTTNLNHLRDNVAALRGV